MIDAEGAESCVLSRTQKAIDLSIQNEERKKKVSSVAHDDKSTLYVMHIYSAAGVSVGPAHTFSDRAVN